MNINRTLHENPAPRQRAYENWDAFTKLWV